ncbi:hypothetical protein BJV82DRAFT_529919 [Fennellomyces sp. T-0311]|nr:hypothetical protein BJV82DRAFT_529919 [Fennellomyces sp. T-0311]
MPDDDDTFAGMPETFDSEFAAENEPPFVDEFAAMPGDIMPPSDEFAAMPGDEYYDPMPEVNYPYEEENLDVNESASMNDTAKMDSVNGTQDAIVESSKSSGATDDFLPTKVEADANKGSAVLPPVPQVTGCRTQGQIAVTYSEGPSDATASIVRQLNHADARANFFVNASWLYTQQYAMVVQNTYHAGHLIGMTYRVQDDDSSKLTDDELRNDIIKKASIIEALIGVAPKYARLHYTEPEDTRTENMLKDLGFVLVGYNLDSQDYQHKAVDEVYKKAFRTYKDTYDAKGSFISVQYDMPGSIKQSTVPQMINTISDEGYTMVRLDGCLNDPKPYKKTASSKEYVSDNFSFNTSGYHQGQKAVPQSVIEEAKKYDNEGTTNNDTTNTQKNTGSHTTASSIAALVGMLISLVIAMLQ